MSKRKKKNYNKFFSYNNVRRENRNFSYKDFGYSKSYNTRFTDSLFYGNNFFKARMKYCGFNGCRFQFIEFNNVSFRGSRFKGAIFENVWFNNCNIEKANFHDAKFVNVYYTNTNVKSASGIPNTNDFIQIDFQKAHIVLSRELQEILLLCKKNEYILKSGTLFYRRKNRISNAKKRELKQMTKAERKNYQRQMQNNQKESFVFHYVNLTRLLRIYSENEVIKGLHLAANSIDRNFASLSYFVPYLKRAGAINK